MGLNTTVLMSLGYCCYAEEASQTFGKFRVVGNLKCFIVDFLNKTCDQSCWINEKLIPNHTLLLFFNVFMYTGLYSTELIF